MINKKKIEEKFEKLEEKIGSQINHLDKEIDKIRRSLFHKVVNVFLAFFILIFLLSLILFGISQTSTFREFLRENIIAIVNEEINGTLAIEKIEGTIFTSLLIKNASLSDKTDKVISFENLKIKLSPLQIFLGKIYVRNIELENVDVNFYKDSLGQLNISKIFPPAEKVDTTKSEFPFVIQVVDLKLKNINFLLQSDENKGSNRDYEVLNLNDLRINNLFLSLGAYADITNNIYELAIDDFSFLMNLKNFQFSYFQTYLRVDENKIEIDNFNLLTNNSNINLNATITDLNLFGELNEEALGKSKINFILNAENFDFKDLNSFFTSPNVLKGNFSTKFSASGSFNELDINQLDIKLNNSNINTTGKIFNLTHPTDLYISSKITNSKIYYNDVKNLFQSLALPDFPNLDFVQFDTLSYEGQPTKFTVNLASTIENGKLNAVADFDMTKGEMVYDIDVFTRALNLNSIIEIPSSLNLALNVKGRGTSVDKISADLSTKIENSNFNNINIKSLELLGSFKNKILLSSIIGSTGNDSIDISAKINFEDPNSPIYQLNSSFRNIQFAKFGLEAENFKSNLNFNFSAVGKNFELDKLNSEIYLDIFDSRINDSIINNQNIKLIVASNDLGKSVQFKSEVIDLNIDGNFSYVSLINFVQGEIAGISKTFIKKADQLIPSLNLTINEKVIQSSRKISEEKFNPFNVNFNLVFKDLKPVIQFIPNIDATVEGKLVGKFENRNNETIFDIEAKFDFLKFSQLDVGYFATDSKIKFSLIYPSQNYAIENFNLDSEININRLYAGTDVEKINTKIKIDEGKLSLTSSAGLSNIVTAAFDLNSNLSSNVLEINFDKLKVAYKDYEFENRNGIKISYLKQKLLIENFNLFRNDSEISINGIFSQYGNQDLVLELKKIKGFEVGFEVLELSPDNIIDGDLNVTAKITGLLNDPQFSVLLTADNIAYQNKKFGSLKSEINYKQKRLISNIVFLEDLESKNERLKIYGNIPINFGLNVSGNRLVNGEKVDITILANQFDLSAMGNVFPFVDELRGILNSNISISGNIGEKIVRTGSLNIREASFLLEQNNLNYNAGLVLRLDDNHIFVDSFVVKNLGGVKNVGSLRGSGKLEFDDFNLISTQFLVNGDLTLLSEESRDKSPTVFGDLFIATKGDIIFASNRERSYLRVPILVREARLTFPALETSFAGDQENFVYRFVTEIQEISKRELEIQELISKSIEKDEEEKLVRPRASTLDYDISVDVDEEASFTYILSKEANLRLNAILKGDLRFESSSGIQNIQGELILLEGSNLEFIKTLTAMGSLKFESDVTNPYLDITATYKNYYLTDTLLNREEEVAVKIRLVGPLQELGKNFTQMDDNIAVYKGAEAIANNQPSEEYDKSDAVWFILTGKFKKDLTAQDQSAAVGELSAFSGTATSLAGTMIGGFLNQYLGNIVRNVEIRAAGAQTKFNLSGNIRNFRYNIGGSTSVFQDLSTANIRVEYPIISNFIIRLERKESFSGATYPTEMINELALKYRIEF